MPDPLVPDDYPEMLAELVMLFHHRLKESLAVDLSADLAFALSEDVREKFGGCLVYFPKGHHYQRVKRNEALLRAFNGRNHNELARRFNLTLSCVYDILSSKREKRQFEIFAAVNGKTVNGSVNVPTNRLQDDLRD